MDLLKFILDPNQLRITCFLCFKQPRDLYSFNVKYNIYCEFSNSELTLKDILCYLFPFHDALSNFACAECATMLIKMYTILHRNITKREVLKVLIQNINDKVKDNKNELNIPGNEMYINLKLFNEKKMDLKHTQINEEVHSKMIKQKVHSCKQCCMKFSNQELLKTHKKISHKNISKSLVCEFCGKSCKKTSTLHAHLNTHCEKTCPYCFKTLKTHSHFKVHIKNHETSTKRVRKKVYKYCSACSYKSLNKMSLEAHINKTHLKIRPYICSICQKAFYKKSNLTEHRFTHNNSNNVVCEVCGEKFLYKKTLNEHLRLHTNTKPFECQICKQRFVTSGRRSDHFKRKHMDKTFSCFLCSKRFSLKKELNAHLKKVHIHSKSESTQYAG